jgi:hypothetical protein
MHRQEDNTVDVQLARYEKPNLISFECWNKHGQHGLNIWLTWCWRGNHKTICCDTSWKAITCKNKDWGPRDSYKIICHVVSLICHLTFNRLHSIISLKIVLFNYKVYFREIGCQDVKQIEPVQQQSPTVLEIMTFWSWNVYSLNLKEYLSTLTWLFIGLYHASIISTTHINTHARNISYRLHTLCPNLTCHYNYPHYYMK